MENNTFADISLHIKIEMINERWGRKAQPELFPELNGNKRNIREPFLLKLYGGQVKWFGLNCFGMGSSRTMFIWQKSDELYEKQILKFFPQLLLV